MDKTAIHQLGAFGQSAWLDYISREIITSGRLQKLIDQGLLGMTSNPTIFNNAISKSTDYDEKIKSLKKTGTSTFDIYDELTIKDIQDAADIFRPVFDKTNGKDGYVSLEINPRLARKTPETIAEGKRLFKKVNRPNVMFKVPSTDEGFPAVEEFLADGMNVNITLIFSLEQYTRTAQSYVRGLKRFSQKSGNLKSIRSVASIFVSRIDTAVDTLLDEKVKNTQEKSQKDTLNNLKGTAAVANSVMIYKKYLEIFGSPEFKELEARGAHKQRVLWASTGTKNPAYSDTKYVTELISRNTVNTMPEKTFDAFIDHGTVQEADFSRAEEQLAGLKTAGIDIDHVCRGLLEKGVVSFENDFGALLKAVEEKAQKVAV